MKILVTGGTGFIGTNVVNQLLDEKHGVFTFSRSGSKYKSSAASIMGDVLNLEALKEATKDIDYVYHLAAEANADRMYKSPIYSTQVNSMGTLNVLEAARANDVKRVLFASTEWIYSGSPEEVVDEDTKIYPVSPNHIYTASKIASELYIQNYHDLYGVDFTIMRYGIPFGPYGRPTTVTPIFLRKAFNKEAITIQGSGDQFRQFIYVEDLADGNVACLNEKVKNQIINLNGKAKITIKNVAETINSLFDNKLEIKYLPARTGDFKGKFVNCDKAKKLLNWEPKASYKEGVKKYLDWFKINELK